MSHRWMKFWPADWQRDPALRSCSLAARGLWMEMLCLAHDAEPYGHVLVGGRPPSPRQLASIVGVSVRDVEKLIAELDEAGVFSVQGGVIYSRRMVRDHAKSQEGREHISKRWADRGADREPTTPPNRAPNTLETEADNKKQIPPKPPIGGRRRSQSDLVGFDRFWALYPRRIGKGQAERAWPKALAAAGDDADAIIAGLKVALSLDRFDMREEGRFCPHPSTWLNGKRWLDGIEPEAPAQPVLRIVQ
jgi:hypothetical protein